MTIYVLIPTTPDRNEQLGRCIDAVNRSICSERIEILTDLNEYEGFVKPTIRMLRRVRGMCLLLGNDVVVAPNMIQRLWDASKKNFIHDDGMCFPVDSRPNIVHLPSHPFAHSRTFLENIYPKYFHNFVDKDLGQVMWRKGKYLLVPDAMYEHMHYTTGKSAFDMTYRIGQVTSDTDGELYQQRLARNFDMKPEDMKVDPSQFHDGPFDI